jgi:hypothetical protein
MSRVGRFLAAHPWIVYALLAIVSFPVLEMILHGEAALQYTHDIFDDDVPRLFSIAADLRAHGAVLWDPHLTAGNGLLAQFALPPTAPDVLLSFLVPPYAAFALNTAFMAFAAGVSMHLFARDSLRLATVACFAGGIMATLAFWHYIYGYAALLLPLLLWSMDRVMADGRRRRDVGVAILLVAFLLFSSQVQIVLIDAAVVLVWVLLTGSGRRSRATRVASFVAIWAVAFLLATPILLSQVVAIPESQRTIWTLQYGYPVVATFRAAARLYGHVVFGVPTLGGSWSASIYGTFFLGALGLPLLVIGCVVPRRTARDRFLLALLVIIPVIDLLTPLDIPLRDHVPMLRSFQFDRVRHLMPVVLIINAAIGASWLAGPDPIGRLGPRRRMVAAVGLVGVGVALAWQVVAAVRGVRASLGSPVHLEGWTLGLLALLGGSIVVLAIGIVVVRRARRAGAGQAVLVGGIATIFLVALAGDRLALARTQRDLGFWMGSWADRMAITPAQAFIASRPGGGRVVSIGEDANRALAAGLDTVGGYETIYPLRYHELFGAMIAPELAIDPVKYRYYHGWGNRADAFGPHLDMAVADLLGVRWLYVRGAPLTDPGVVDRFSGGGVRVYENPAAFPRAFLVHDARVMLDRAAVISAIGTATADDLRGRAFLAAPDLAAGGSSSAGTGLSGGPPDPADEATIEADTIDRLTIRARTAAPAILILADTYTPDWVAEVDGAPARVIPVDGALRGVVVPAGEHQITFAYRPIATYAGIVIALTAAVALACWLALGRVRRPDRSGGSLT